MYGSVYYNKRTSTINWSEYDADGVRSEHKKKWVPDFYRNTNKETDFKSQCGLNLERVVCKTFGERNSKIKELKESKYKTFGSDLSPENKFILETWPQDLSEPPPIRFMFLDIETEVESGFPVPELAVERVNVITCWSSADETYHVFVLEQNYKDTTGLPIKLKICKDERMLLMEFVKFIEKSRHDIWSGWNSSGFDIPYLFNRILRVLDKVDVTRHSELLHRMKDDPTDEEREEIRDIESRFKYIERLSPYKKVIKKIKMMKDPFTKQMKPQLFYLIEGITDYDYMELDKQFNMHKRDSYKLDVVAQDELGESKLEYEGTFKEFYQKEWNRFVEYNIQDVRLLVLLNQNLNYIPQAIALSYKCHCVFKDNFGTTQKAEAAVYNFLFKGNVIMGDRGKQPDEAPPIPGGFVTKVDDLRRGLHRWIIDVDIASLYPSLMRGMNISYETKVGELKYNSSENFFSLPDDMDVYVVKDGEDPKKFTAKQVKAFIRKNKYHLSARNVIFKNVKTDKGVLVKMLDMWYSQRKADKKLEAGYRQKAVDIFQDAEECEGGVLIEEGADKKTMNPELAEQYTEFMRLSKVHYNLQWSCKILLNSIYGCLASGYSRFYGAELAASITLSGQSVIKHNGEMLNEFFNKDFFEMNIVKKSFPDLDESIGDVDARLYTDTDSSVYETVIRTNKGALQIGDLYEMFKKKNQEMSQYGHEIVDVSDEDLECLTYNEENKKSEMGKIKKLVRHKVTKKKWRIKVDGKEVIVTEDHCAMIKREGELLRVKPKEIQKGDKILTIF